MDAAGKHRVGVPLPGGTVTSICGGSVQDLYHLIWNAPPSRAVPLDGTRRTVSKSGSYSATRLTGGSSGFQGGQSLRCLVQVCGLWVLFKPSQATDAPTIRSWMDYPRLQGCGVGLGVPLKQRARLSAPVVRDNGGTEIGLQGTWQH